MPRYSAEDSLGVSLRVLPGEISMRIGGLSIKQVALPNVGRGLGIQSSKSPEEGRSGPFLPEGRARTLIPFCPWC